MTFPVRRVIFKQSNMFGGGWLGHRPASAGFSIFREAISYHISHTPRLLQPCPHQLHHRLIDRIPLALGETRLVNLYKTLES